MVDLSGGSELEFNQAHRVGLPSWKSKEKSKIFPAPKQKTIASWRRLDLRFLCAE